MIRGPPRSTPFPYTGLFRSEHLFRLDHLATRMRRNAEDLIVLSGADPGRHWVQPMTLVDVVRAAAAEVEEYQRVEFLPLADRSEEHTSELQSRQYLVCRLLL